MNHRHVCEIEQEILKLTGKVTIFTFNPHLLPTFRGILTSIYLKPNKNVNLEKITTYLKKYFKNSKFVKILKTNTQIGSGNILNTN